MTDHKQQLAAGLGAARDKLERLTAEDAALERRASKLSAEVAASDSSDAEALATVRGGAPMRKAPKPNDSARHELDTITAARRALAAEIATTQQTVGSLSRDLDRATMREIGARVVANGARVDRLLVELDNAIAESNRLYEDAMADRLAFRLGLQSDLLDHLCGSFRIGNAMSHRVRDLARAPFGERHRIEDLDRMFFKRLD
ncbi:MAG: hypothetical protein KGJ66_04230 [Alphaproteobacteria bacterium]|nr:hypothetical protein [Alphaproteobacteria bacterium]